MGVDELIDELIEREGGYVNHPADRGGHLRTERRTLRITRGGTRCLSR